MLWFHDQMDKPSPINLQFPIWKFWWKKNENTSWINDWIYTNLAQFCKCFTSLQFTLEFYHFNYPNQRQNNSLSYFFKDNIDTISGSLCYHLHPFSPAVGIPVLVLFAAAKPYKRGFYCDDQTLMHPYLSNTIPTWVAGFVGIILPSVTVYFLFSLNTRICVCVFLNK